MDLSPLFKGLPHESRTIIAAFAVNAIVSFNAFLLALPAFSSFSLPVECVISCTSSIFATAFAYIPFLLVRRFHERFLKKRLKADILYFCLPFLTASLAVFILHLAGEANGLAVMELYAATFLAFYIIIAVTYVPAFLYCLRQSHKGLEDRQHKPDDSHQEKRENDEPHLRV